MTQAPSGSIASLDRTTKILFATVAVLALAGVIVSAISLQRHYAKSDTQFCDLGQKFNCDIVNRSEYSEIIGIPVAAVGIAGYAALFVLGTFQRRSAHTPVRLLSASLVGFAFALYLTYIEDHVLRTWCILCLISLVLIALISALGIALKARDSIA